MGNVGHAKCPSDMALCPFIQAAKSVSLQLVASTSLVHDAPEAFSASTLDPILPASTILVTLLHHSFSRSCRRLESHRILKSDYSSYRNLLARGASAIFDLTDLR
jgi:hypothetical protein